MRKAQIEQNLADEQTRLRRVEAHLRALERGHEMDLRDVVIKLSEPVRVVEAVGSAPGYGPENISPVFQPLCHQVHAYLVNNGVRPGINIGRYEGPSEDGTVTLHVGFDIGGQDVPIDDQLRIVELPAVRVAAFVHRGTMDDIAPTFEAMIGWIKDSGYTLARPGTSPSCSCCSALTWESRLLTKEPVLGRDEIGRLRGAPGAGRIGADLGRA